MQDFRNLRVWRHSHALTLEIYRSSASWPPAERFGLARQTCRASASIAANIAEGCASQSDRTFARHLHIAFGSAAELDYHLLLAADLGLLTRAEHAHLAAPLAEVKRMLASLIKRLQKHQNANQLPTLRQLIRSPGNLHCER